MKVSGIQITDTELIFNAFPSREIGLALYCKSFKVYLKDIKFIAISPRLALDDETIFILIVDTKQKVYPIPAHVLRTKGLHQLETYFSLQSILDDWEKFEYEDHYGKVDKIIYPKELYWQDLFENDWKLKIRYCYSWAKPKAFFGNFNKKLLS